MIEDERPKFLAADVIKKKSGRAPRTAISFTQWFTRSAPTVSCLFIANVIFNFVRRHQCLRRESVRAFRKFGEQAAKAADFSEDLQPVRLSNERLNPPLESIPKVDIYARMRARFVVFLQGAVSFLREGNAFPYKKMRAAYFRSANSVGCIS